MGKKIASIFILLYIFANCVFPQDSLNYNNSETIKTGKLAPIIAFGTILSLSGIYYINPRGYDEHERVPFHFVNDNAGYLQMDKFKHLYYSYFGSYIGYQLLKDAGFKKYIALLFGGTLGLVILTPKEIYDGLYEPGGFSWGDIAADAAGSSLLIGQEILFDEQIFKLKFSFSRSEYVDQANGYLGISLPRRFSRDFNGHTYWLSFNANKFILKKQLPAWIDIAVGYSANGMFGQYENIKSYNGVIIPETQRYRQFLLSLDIDWTKIKTKSKLVKTIFKGMNFIKVPFPAIEVNSKGQLKGYWLYF